jgi:hypothetical protein
MLKTQIWCSYDIVYPHSWVTGKTAHRASDLVVDLSLGFNSPSRLSIYYWPFKTLLSLTVHR